MLETCILQFEGVNLQISDRSQISQIKEVSASVDCVSLVAKKNPPRGEDYKGFLLLPTICKHGWRCDISYPNGTLRQAGVFHNFPEKALSWGKEIIDTGNVYSTPVGQRLFADEPTVVRPFLSFFDLIFSHHFPSGDRTYWLLAAYLLLHFGEQGRIDFWDDSLVKKLKLGPRQFMNRRKSLARAGIIRWVSWSNQNCPTTYYIGPAWLSVQGVTLTSVELRALEDGETGMGRGYLSIDISTIETFCGKRV